MGQFNSMQPQRVNPDSAIAWFRFGWQCFMANPGMWIVLVILFLLIVLALQFIPFLGPLALSLITPALIGGLLYAASEASANRPIEIAHLFVGLTDENRRTPMLKLGAIWLVLSILLGIVVTLVIGGTIGMGALTRDMVVEREAVVTSAVSLSILIAFIVVLALILVIFAWMVYAVPLVLFNKFTPLAAMGHSAKAAMMNAIPLLVFSTVYIVLAVIASIPFGLGFFILIPVTVGALLASYQEIYIEQH